jgi:hypothetical protein
MIFKGEINFHDKILFLPYTKIVLRRFKKI